MVQEDGKLHIHNHLRFTILYHRDPETDLARIVGFEVEPFSVKHKYDGKWNADRPELKTCNSNSMKFVSEKDIKQEVKEGEEIVFTYDVTFKVGRPVAHGAALDGWFNQGSEYLCRPPHAPIRAIHMRLPPICAPAAKLPVASTSLAPWTGKLHTGKSVQVLGRFMSVD